MRRTAILKLAAAITISLPASAITTFLDNPNDPLYIADGSFYSGVARLTIGIPALGNFGCTGSLLNGARAVLTAAHCVTDDSGALVSGTSVTANFGAPGSATSTNIVVFPFYDANTNFGDLALVFLGSPFLGVTTYDLYRSFDEAGQIGDIVGFGRFGSGATGSVNSGNGVRRHGSNLIDYTASNTGLPASGAAATMLASDFDNGLPQNNAFALISAAFSDLGVGNLEANTAPGDSGGPTFLSNRVAAITSYGACFASSFNCDIPPDVDGALNSSFGEIMVNTRVSAFAPWIDEQLAEIPEPGTLALLGLGLAVIAGARLRAR